MNTSQLRSKWRLWKVAAIALLMTGTLMAAEDTQTKKRQTADQASRSWFESLSWEERQELLYDLDASQIQGDCQQELVIQIYTLDAELVSQFTAYQETPVKDVELRDLLNRSDYLMSLDNEIYFMLFD